MKPTDVLVQQFVLRAVHNGTVLKEADCKHRALDGNSEFCILLKLSWFKGRNKKRRLVKKSVDSVKRFSRYPSNYCCHGNQF